MSRFNQRGQRGATLVTALVMLVVLTLLVISAIRSSTTNLRIAGNMQMQSEAVAAGQQAIEQVINTNFTAAPASATLNVPMGPATYTANVAAPVCTGSVPLTNNTPNLPKQCVSQSTLGQVGIFFTSGTAMAATSWCAAQQWDIQVAVTDANGTSTDNMHQGVSINVPTGTTCTLQAPPI